MEHPKNRPVMTCKELCEDGSTSRLPRYALLTAREFLKMVWMLSGQRATRSTLQFYSSPKARLLPLPVYRNRHTAHYLHPEHTLRFAILLHLRAAYFLPLKLAKVVLDGLSPALYDLVLSDVLSASDIVRLAQGSEPKWVKEALVGRASRALEAARIIGKTLKQIAEPLSEASELAEHQRFYNRTSARTEAVVARPV